MEERNNYLDPVVCPVCEKTVFDHTNSFDICDVCGWENDGVQADDHNYTGGANVMSVNEARKAWKEGKKVY